jgi:Ca2+-binding EF-hand superfamily protein
VFTAIAAVTLCDKASVALTKDCDILFLYHCHPAHLPDTIEEQEMTKFKIMAGALTLSMASAALYAAPGMKADANGDNAITKAEAIAAADARFAKMDANKDGAINEADKTARLKDRFAKLDTDKNGSVSEAEFLAAREARAEKREERREKRMGRAGADGKMARHHGRRGGGMKMMAMADTNGDKSISNAEFRAAAEARFARADTNNDGTISAEERNTQRKGKWGGKRPVSPAPTPDAG